tara:strand:+ start:4383 stop:5111 length:729 start_codon:yes stop_codon:yes gene_type:complete
MFGIIKNKLDNILVESFNNKETFKKVFHESMAALKTNKTSREFFVVYSQLENKKFKDSTQAEKYLNETLEFLKEKKKHLRLNKLQNTLNKFNKFHKKGRNALYENLDFLIFESNILDIEKRIEAKKSIVRKITTTKKEFVIEANVPNSLLIHLSTKKFNEKFINLKEGDKKKFKELFNKDIIKLENEMVPLIEEVSNKIDGLISETKDEGLLKKLEQTRNRVVESNIDKVSFYKIKELNRTL